MTELATQLVSTSLTLHVGAPVKAGGNIGALIN